MKERITLEIPSVLRQDESNDREVNRQGRGWWVSKPAKPYPALKRCPFCGGIAILEEVESEDGYRFDVYCLNTQYCGGTTSRCRSAAKAIEFWNRRVNEVTVNTPQLPRALLVG